METRPHKKGIMDMVYIRSGEPLSVNTYSKKRTGPMSKR